MPVGVASVPVQHRVWSALLAQDEPVRFGELVPAGANRASAYQSLERWVSAGLVERTGSPSHYRYHLNDNTDRSPMPPVVTASGSAVRRASPAYQRIWSAIRVLRRFDLPLLIITAQVRERQLSGYIGLLRRTGYVDLVQLGNPQRGIVSRYRLVRDPGPKAPRETLRVTPAGTARLLVDPNTGQEHDVGRGSPSRRRAYRRSPGLADGGVG